MTVTVDAGRCIACGMCAYAAPEVFRVAGSASAVISQPEGKTAGSGTPPTAAR